MKQLKKKTFYLDLEELGHSSKDFENLKVKDLTSETNFQLRRGSTCSTTEPVTLNKYASAYLNQQHSDPGYNKGALAQRDQQHSDPDRIIQIKRISHAKV